MRSPGLLCGLAVEKRMGPRPDPKGGPMSSALGPNVELNKSTIVMM